MFININIKIMEKIDVDNAMRNVRKFCKNYQKKCNKIKCSECDHCPLACMSQFYGNGKIFILIKDAKLRRRDIIDYTIHFTDHEILHGILYYLESDEASHKLDLIRHLINEDDIVKGFDYDKYICAKD